VAKGFSYEAFRARVDEVIRLLTAQGPQQAQALRPGAERA